MTSSYPSDDATRIITGCGEVICEIESASNLPVRAVCSKVSRRRRRPRLDSGKQGPAKRPVRPSVKPSRRWLRNWFKTLSDFRVFSR